MRKIPKYLKNTTFISKQIEINICIPNTLYYFISFIVSSGIFVKLFNVSVLVRYEKNIYKKLVKTTKNKKLPDYKSLKLPSDLKFRKIVLSHLFVFIDFIRLILHLNIFVYNYSF